MGPNLFTRVVTHRLAAREPSAEGRLVFDSRLWELLSERSSLGNPAFARPRLRSSALFVAGAPHLSGQLGTHFGGILVGIKTREEMHRLAVHLDDRCDPLGFQLAFFNQAFIPHDEPQPGFGTSIHPNDVCLAAQRGDVGIGFAGSIRIAQGANVSPLRATP